jgi:hypothetical protein
MGKLDRGFAIAAVVFAFAAGSPAQSSTQSLQRALISFKNHITVGISYVEFAPAVADLNTEIELAQRSQTLPPKATHSLTQLQADMAIMGELWSLRFGPLASPDSPFTFCDSEIGKLFASTGSTFKEQGLLDADLKTEDLSGQCAYYNDTTLAALLSAVAKQADRSVDALSAPHKSVHGHH